MGRPRSIRATRRPRPSLIRARATRCATAKGWTGESKAGSPMRALGPIVALVVLVLLLASGALYTVDQRQNAIVFQLGEVKEVVTKPGLHVKWPLLQNVRQFDMRILTYD